MHRQQESIYTAVLWLGKLNSCLKKFMGAGWGKKRWRAKSKKEPGTEGTGLILMVSIQMHFCRILAAACGSTPARASGTLFEAWQSEILIAFVLDLITLQSHSIGLLLRCISFFCDYNNAAYHCIPLSRRILICRSFLSSRNFAHTVQCA